MFGFLSGGIILLLLLSIPVAVVLFLLGIGVDIFFNPFPLVKALGQNFWTAGNSFLLMAIPLFVFMGEIIVRSGVANKAYAAMDRWLSWLPGGLLHANIATSTLFSATSGSSVATAATVSTVAIPQSKTLHYDPKLFAGSIAAGGTLGILIPPSINLIVYGFLTETSIPKLFMAGLLPGLLMALTFMLCCGMMCYFFPRLGGEAKSYSWEQRWQSLKYLLPLLVLFLTIVGTIYSGWATPTEAAAIGVVASALIAWFNGNSSWSMLLAAAKQTINVTAMILFIILAASFLNFVLASSGIVNKLSTLIQTMALGRYGLLLMIILILFLLGFFIETLSLMIITIPIFTPLLIAQGFDPVWFGIIMIIFVEMALITPPVGLNLYIVQSARQGEPFLDVILGTLPFVICMLLVAGILIVYPEIATWLPDVLSQQEFKQ